MLKLYEILTITKKFHHIQDHVIAIDTRSQNNNLLKTIPPYLNNNNSKPNTTYYFDCRSI